MQQQKAWQIEKRKGFTKAVSRLPHTLSTKTGIRDETKDVEFLELNNKFTACEKVTANLLAEVCKYRDNVTALLNHQAEFGIILAEIYDPSLAMPSGEVTPRRVQTAPESLQAVDDFQAVMREMRDILLPEVDKLELSVVQPLTELQNNMKLIRKTITKRDHKLVDYDRFRISLKKLQDKKERTLSDEKQIYKLESQLEVATADYEGLNGLLREELPGFFYYRTQLMEPIFHAFFYLQARIYNIMLDRIGPLSSNGYFDLSMDIRQGYEARKQDTLPTVESVELITKKSVAATYTSKYGRSSPHEMGPTTSTYAPAPAATSPVAVRGYSPPVPSAKPWQAAPAAGAKPWQTGAASATPKPWQAAGAVSRSNHDTSPPPPAYNTVQNGGAANNGSQAAGSGAGASRFQSPQNINIHLAPSVSGTIAATATAAATSHAIHGINNGINNWQAEAVKKGPPPPPPKKLGAAAGVKMVVALYDYDAQQAGDLSFRKDDRIELVERTANTDDWWTGKLNGRQGVFPAVKRIMQEARELLSEPSTDFAANPLESDIFEWHFTIRGPEATEFEGGLYHGRILLPNNYPFAPPSLMFLTPNGRFELHKKVCLSITGYHPEYWQPAWGIRTVLVAVMGFLPTQSKGAIGGLDVSVEARKALAIKSKTWTCSTCRSENVVILPDVAPEDVVKVSLKADEMPPEFSFGYEADKKKQEETDDKERAAAAGASKTTGTITIPPPARSSSSPSPTLTAATVVRDLRHQAATPSDPRSSSNSLEPRTVPPQHQSLYQPQAPEQIQAVRPADSSIPVWLDVLILGFGGVLVALIIRRFV
ncbi:hypothetical protein EDD11_002331 [Mortierella claussenii]|nr:hypothetical protein EDD11_002331 [Mortierella claussenii]